jgi:hypothetical protein
MKFTHEVLGIGTQLENHGSASGEWILSYRIRDFRLFIGQRPYNNPKDTENSFFQHRLPA